MRHRGCRILIIIFCKRQVGSFLKPLLAALAVCPGNNSKEAKQPQDCRQGTQIVDVHGLLLHGAQCRTHALQVSNENIHFRLVTDGGLGPLDFLVGVSRNATSVCIATHQLHLGHYVSADSILSLITRQECEGRHIGLRHHVTRIRQVSTLPLV